MVWFHEWASGLWTDVAYGRYVVAAAATAAINVYCAVCRFFNSLFFLLAFFGHWSETTAKFIIIIMIVKTMIVFLTMSKTFKVVFVFIFWAFNKRSISWSSVRRTFHWIVGALSDLYLCCCLLTTRLASFGLCSDYLLLCFIGKIWGLATLVEIRNANKVWACQ